MPMNSSNELLILEKKLENADTKEIILNKFIFKPKIEKIQTNTIFQETKHFLEELKTANEDLFNDTQKLEMANIEKRTKNKQHQGQMINMDLNLGILEKKESLSNFEDITNEDLIRMIMPIHKTKTKSKVKKKLKKLKS